MSNYFHTVFQIRKGFGKCGLIFKILSPMIHNEILYVYTTETFTLPEVCCLLSVSFLACNSKIV